MSEQRRKSKLCRTCFMRVPKCIYGNNNMNNLRTIEAQIVQKLKNNEPWPKFAGSYKEKNVYYWIDHVHLRQRTYPSLVHSKQQTKIHFILKTVRSVQFFRAYMYLLNRSRELGKRLIAKNKQILRSTMNVSRR